MTGGRIAGDVAAKLIHQGDFSAKAMEPYKKRWMKAEGKKQEAFYRIAEAISEITDDQFNKLAHRLVKTTPDQLTLTKIFTAIAREKPKILLDVTRAFAGL